MNMLSEVHPKGTSFGRIPRGSKSSFIGRGVDERT